MKTIVRLTKYGIIFSCFYSLMLVPYAYAETCDLEDPDFPEEDCSFDGINTQMLKFGKIDREETAELFFGNARYELELGSSGTTVVNTVDDDDCSTTSINNIPLGDLEDEEIAFLPSSNDPRLISDIWVLDCTIVQDR